MYRDVQWLYTEIIFKGQVKMETTDGIIKLHFDVCGADKNLA